MHDVDCKIKQVERILGYTFNNKLTCAEGLQMASGPRAILAINGKFCKVNINRRLAILGDVTATYLLCKVWYNSMDRFGYHLQTSADWARIREDVLSNPALARLGYSLQVDSCIIAAPGLQEKPGTPMMATALQALFGAVYQDGDEAALVRVLKHIGLFEQMVEGPEDPVLQPETEVPRADQAEARSSSREKFPFQVSSSIPTWLARGISASGGIEI